MDEEKGVRVLEPRPDECAYPIPQGMSCGTDLRVGYIADQLLLVTPTIGHFQKVGSVICPEAVLSFVQVGPTCPRSKHKSDPRVILVPVPRLKPVFQYSFANRASDKRLKCGSRQRNGLDSVRTDLCLSKKELRYGWTRLHSLDIKAFHPNM